MPPEVYTATHTDVVDTRHLGHPGVSDAAAGAAENHPHTHVRATDEYQQLTSTMLVCEHWDQQIHTYRLDLANTEKNGDYCRTAIEKIVSYPPTHAHATTSPERAAQTQTAANEGAKTAAQVDADRAGAAQAVAASVGPSEETSRSNPTAAATTTHFHHLVRMKRTRRGAANDDRYSHERQSAGSGAGSDGGGGGGGGEVGGGSGTVMVFAGHDVKLLTDSANRLECALPPGSLVDPVMDCVYDSRSRCAVNSKTPPTLP